jgi:hypothetical protein
MPIPCSIALGMLGSHTSSGTIGATKHDRYFYLLFHHKKNTPEQHAFRNIKIPSGKIEITS